jgi:hypothetical protein
MSVPDINYDWKALSIKQPAASMIVDGVKRVENRNVRQYKDTTLRGRWIMIHASLGSVESATCIQQYPSHIPDIYKTPAANTERIPRGKIIGLARIKEVSSYNDIDDVPTKQWAHPGDACILFDEILRLTVPVSVPGGLNTWTLKPAPVWTPPRRLSKKDSTLTEEELGIWRMTQEDKYRKQSLTKRVALINILLAVRRGENVVTWSESAQNGESIRLS